jgi:hypothetical protein
MNKGLEPVSSEEEARIIRDCIKGANNINQLTDKAYKFLYLSSGFIAHYDREGFKSNYREPGSLKAEILNYQPHNQWGNFTPRDADYEYYMQKKRIYNGICEGLKNNIQYHVKRNRLPLKEFDFGR